MNYSIIEVGNTYFVTDEENKEYYINFLEKVDWDDEFFKRFKNFGHKKNEKIRPVDYELYKCNNNIYVMFIVVNQKILHNVVFLDFSGTKSITMKSIVDLSKQDAALYSMKNGIEEI